MSGRPELSAAPPDVLLTFDNLGEAADLERGVSPAAAPSGAHPTVTEALPRILARLRALDLTATFFVEAWNCSVYPEAVTGIAAAGHEVGWHGWRHEVWADLSPARQAELLLRGRAAFDTLGLDVRGFRPPGGDLPPGAWTALARAGVAWCSPAATGEAATGDAPGTAADPDAGGAEGVAAFPFHWADVDAYHLMSSFAARRARFGDPAATASAAATAERLRAAIERRPTQAGPLVIILHPFLLLDEDWAAAADGVLVRLAELARAGTRRVAPGSTLLEPGRRS